MSKKLGINISYMNAFAEALKRLMVAKGLKQKDIADYLSLSKQVVSNWFTKGYQPDLEHIPKLATLLGLTTDDLFRAMGAVIVAETDTELSVAEEISPTQLLKMQAKISELQERLINYQAKDLEEQGRLIKQQEAEIERQRLRPDRDSTNISSK